MEIKVFKRQKGEEWDGKEVKGGRKEVDTCNQYDDKDIEKKLIWQENWLSWKMTKNSDNTRRWEMNDWLPIKNYL